jgi:frizzled 5/8
VKFLIIIKNLFQFRFKMFNYFLLFIISSFFILICDSTSLLIVSPVGKKKSFNYNEHPATCEEISVPMCRNMPYNFTLMPNQFNHETQQDAALEVHQFWALVEINCSKDMKFFLCSMYTPICIQNYGQPIRACRSVCERARGGCEKYMKKFGFEWPEHMNCNLFPEYGSVKDVCMDPMDALNEESKELQKVIPSFINTQEKIVFQTPLSETINKPLIIDSCLKPLIKITDIKDIRYNQVSTAGIINCVRPCFDKLFSDFEYKFSYYWILFWTIFCFLSTISTVLTFLIDRNRFKYPEKPIIYLSICYLLVSCGFLLKYIAGHESIACELDGSIKGIISSSRNTTGSSVILCTITFFLIYYFSMASSVWWVIISFTWLLAAGRKWGTESISKYNHYFHLVAWALPALKTSIIMLKGYIDADSLSGICYVGNTSVQALNMFIIIPIFFYLACVIVFLLFGFMSFFRLREMIKKQQVQAKTSKLNKLMTRIGIFSILYTIPVTGLLSCYVYEQYYRLEWEHNYLCSKQVADGKSIVVDCMNTRKPEFAVFMIKYFCILIIGITSGFWTWNKKTLVSWNYFFKKCCCKTRKSSYSKGIQKDSVIYFHKSTENPIVELTPSPQHQRLKESNNVKTQDNETNYCNIGGNTSVFDSEPIGFTRNHTVSIKNSKLVKTSSLSSDSTISTSQTNSYSLVSNPPLPYSPHQQRTDYYRPSNKKYVLASPTFIRK